MIILILGMHRSGTSALAGLLHSGGVHLGDVFMPPLPENPKGFFEDLQIQGVNKQILASIGKSWKDIPTPQDLLKVPKPVLQLIPQIYALFRNRFTIWSWKDPRFCLTFPLWATVLPLSEIRVLYIVRHPASVAKSVLTRNNTPLVEGLNLWKAYNLRILQLLEHYRLPFVLLQYEDLIEDPQSVQRLLERTLGLHLNEAWRFVDKSLNRSQSTEIELPSEIQNLYEAILREYGMQGKMDNAKAQSICVS